MSNDGDGVESSSRSTRDGVDSVSTVVNSRNLRENGSRRSEGEKESVESHDCAVGELTGKERVCERRETKRSGKLNSI